MRIDRPIHGLHLKKFQYLVKLLLLALLKFLLALLQITILIVLPGAYCLDLLPHLLHVLLQDKFHLSLLCGISGLGLDDTLVNFIDPSDQFALILVKKSLCVSFYRLQLSFPACLIIHIFVHFDHI